MSSARNTTRPGLEARVSGRLPPHDVDAEAAVLSACMLEPRMSDLVTGTLDPDDFYDQRNALVFGAIRELTKRNTPCDIVTVASHLRAVGQLQHAGGAAYLAEVCDATPAVHNLESHARIVTSKARVRNMVALAHRVAAEGYDEMSDADEWIGKVEARVFDAARSRDQSKEPQHISAIMKKAYERLAEAAESDRATMGLSTRLAELDTLTNGLNTGDVTILAARPGMGKTAMAMTMAMGACETPMKCDDGKLRGTAVAVFSLEMPDEQLAVRTLCSESGVSMSAQRSARLTPDDWSKLAQGAGDVAQYGIWVHDKPSITIGELRSKLRRIRIQAERRGLVLRLVVIDYLQLMSGRDLVEKNASRENEVSAISRRLKEIAKDEGVHVLALAQLNRDCEKRPDKRPVAADLRESGGIEQDADNIVLIFRQEHYEPENREAHGMAELIVDKQRNGSRGVVKVAFKADLVRFDNLAHSGAAANQQSGGYYPADDSF
jgi:replicative DNA helicase